MAVHFTPEQLAAMATLITMAFAQVGLVPGQPLQVQAPVALGPPNINSNKLDVAKPRDYAGGADYPAFCQECTVYMEANSIALNTDRLKILFVLSYLKGGHAKTWAQNYTRARTVNGALTIVGSFADFSALLDQSFEDPNRAEKALEEFRNLVQGNLTASEFFAHFEILRTDAKLTDPAHDTILIDRLKHALAGPVV